ncbi:MAG: hypothetical protein LUC18_04020, partial [Porphyromonadaceae bacterium]|nr:hypothetical protein [Porphyromonadaceae bacterium]
TATSQDPVAVSDVPVVETGDAPSQTAVPAEAVKKNTRRKRFGRSIQNRCPGYFQAQAQQVFESTGGEYHEVPNQYRASQYDHTSDQYVKKKLSDRMFKLSDGTLVQRDWYSSFLLYCAKKDLESPNRKTCLDKFPDLYSKEVAMVKAIASSGHKVMNSGIKPVSIK